MTDQTLDVVTDDSLFGGIIGEARSRRLGLGLMLIGWVHLAIFSFCEALFLHGDRAASHFLPLWGLDVVAALVLVRGRIPGLARSGSHGLTRISVRVWLTFALLCFTSVSLNSLTGFAIDWFKISWALLGTFAFAMMAWIFHIAFLIPAVQMSITALLVAAYPEHAYLILGCSGLLVCNGLGGLLEKPRWSRLDLPSRPHRPDHAMDTRVG